MGSIGIACTRSCGRGTVATCWALLIEQPLANLEQRVYEWYLDAKAKAGAHRTELDVGLCFVPLLRWIVALVIWSLAPPTARRICLIGVHFWD